MAGDSSLDFSPLSEFSAATIYEPVQKASDFSAEDNSSGRVAIERIVPAALAFVAGIAFPLGAMWLVRPGSDWMLNPDSIVYVALARAMVHGCGFAPYNGSCGAPEVLRTPVIRCS